MYLKIGGKCTCKQSRLAQMKWNKSDIVTDAARGFVVHTSKDIKNWMLAFLINF